jgi:ubiquinone/menaquinone biosynthesis C-methylase UbiE
MSLKAMYNQIADQYEFADRFGAITQSHACAIAQIRAAHLGETPFYKVLDLGVGDASFIKKLSCYLSEASYSGIDISSQMLAHAKQNMPQFTAIEGNSAHASELLPFHSQDLVLAHFINAYIPIDLLFEQAERLTRANGTFSVITTTYDSFPVAQQYLADFIASNSIWSTMVGHYYKSMIKNTTVATNQQSLLKTFDNHQFEVIAHQRLNLPIDLENIDDLAQFGIEGTWFLNTVNVNFLPKRFLIKRMRQFFEKIFTFPYQDTHVVDVVLARKR